MRRNTSLSARYIANFLDDKSVSYKRVVPDLGQPTIKTGALLLILLIPAFAWGSWAMFGHVMLQGHFN